MVDTKMASVDQRNLFLWRRCVLGMSEKNINVTTSSSTCQSHTNADSLTYTSPPSSPLPNWPPLKTIFKLLQWYIGQNRKPKLIVVSFESWYTLLVATCYWILWLNGHISVITCQVPHRRCWISDMKWHVWDLRESGPIEPQSQAAQAPKTVHQGTTTFLTLVFTFNIHIHKNMITFCLTLYAQSLPSSMFTYT